MKKKNEYMVLQSDITYATRINKNLLQDYNNFCNKQNIKQSQQSKELIIEFMTNKEYVKRVLYVDATKYPSQNNTQIATFLPTELLNDFKTKCQALSVKPSKVMRSLLIDYIDKHQDNTKTTPTSEKDKKKLYYLSQATNYATSFRISRELYDDFQDKCKKYNLDYAKTVRHCMIDWLIDDDK